MGRAGSNHVSVLRPYRWVVQCARLVRVRVVRPCDVVPHVLEGGRHGERQDHAARRTDVRKRGVRHHAQDSFLPHALHVDGRHEIVHVPEYADLFHGYFHPLHDGLVAHDLRVVARYDERVARPRIRDAREGPRLQRHRVIQGRAANMRVIHPFHVQHAAARVLVAFLQLGLFIVRDERARPLDVAKRDAHEGPLRRANAHDERVVPFVCAVQAVPRALDVGEHLLHVANVEGGLVEHSPRHVYDVLISDRRHDIHNQQHVSVGHAFRHDAGAAGDQRPHARLDRPQHRPAQRVHLDDAPDHLAEVHVVDV